MAGSLAGFGRSRLGRVAAGFASLFLLEEEFGGKMEILAALTIGAVALGGEVDAWFGLVVGRGVQFGADL